MKKLKIFFLILFLTITVITQAYSQEDKEKEYSDLSIRLLTHLRNSEFENASGLFHYPVTLTPEKVSKEKQKVKQKLNVVLNEFGEFLGFRSDNTSQGTIGVGVSGAEIAYWKAGRKKFRRMIYPVEFKNEGPGFVKIGFCNIKDKIEIQGVEFLIPLSDQAKKRVSEINKMIGQKDQQ